jgi:hypothetical protein
MAIYTGFSTQDVNKRIQNLDPTVGGGISTITQQAQIGKKFRLTDDKLIIRDLINALSIKQGDKVGQPEYGTTIWEYMFEPNTDDVVVEIEKEIRRVVGSDPRVTLDNINAYSYENGILVELQITILVIDTYLEFGLLIDKQTGTIQALSA